MWLHSHIVATFRWRVNVRLGLCGIRQGDKGDGRGEEDRVSPDSNCGAVRDVPVYDVVIEKVEQIKK